MLTLPCAGLVGTGAGFPLLVPVIVSGALWNGSFGLVAALHQAAAVRSRAVPPDLAGAWVVATSNLGVALGAAVGATLLDRAGIQTLPRAAAVAVALAVSVVAPGAARVPEPAISVLRDGGAQPK